MAVVTKGGTLPGSSQKTDFYTLVDSATVTGILNADCHANMGLVDTKLAQIATASKVSGTALTLLTSVPSAAGGLPPVNRITTPSALTSAETITIADAKAANIYTLTAEHNFTLANPTADATTGQPFLFKITQDGTGSRTIAFGSKWKSSLNVGDIVLSTAASAVDVFGGFFDGTNYLILGFEKAVSQSA